MRKWNGLVWILIYLTVALLPSPLLARTIVLDSGDAPPAEAFTTSPMSSTGLAPAERRVNIPYFNDDIIFEETAIFWFGYVTSTNNYADIRVGYNDQKLYVRLGAFDRRLWYDTSPTPETLTDWDAATLYLDISENHDTMLDTATYRFNGQYSWWEDRDKYQALYQHDGTNWQTVSLPISTTIGWRGDAPNKDSDDQGWTITYHVPFSSLGLSGPPAQGTVWRMALVLHDRDGTTDTPSHQTWPETPDFEDPTTWGQLAFGLPSYARPEGTAIGTSTIRHNLDGAVVMDAGVGGYTTCAEGVDFWTEWGDTNEAYYNPGRTDFNIQNQSDIGDWPCFSKFYITFPLDAIPANKQILTATLTLHQFGGSGAPGEAEPSLIQVLTVAEDWNDTTLTWNNAPLAVENVSQAWVDPTIFPGWPGVARDWDISLAVARAYEAGEPARLVMYESDSSYHSGKYFVASNVDEWNAEGRPTLKVIWTEAQAMVKKTAWPVVASVNTTVTYTISALGNGKALTLTDKLPSEVSAPGAISVPPGQPAATYSAATHTLSWIGTPGVGESLTLTFPVTVLYNGTKTILNTVILTESTGAVSTATASVIIDALQIHLPLIIKK